MRSAAARTDPADGARDRRTGFVPDGTRNGAHPVVRPPLRVLSGAARPERPGARRTLAPTGPEAPTRRYVPALDGLRALAVGAVVAYHLGFGWARGGYFGVDIFFVLSGYLITDGLLTGWRSGHAVDLKRFWIARARRLLPALAVLLVVVAAAATAFARGSLGALRGDTLAALTYTSNWWQVSRQHSYFAATGSVSPLQHLWSLAVEEQFYLVWPILLGLALRWLPRRLLVRLILLAAVASAVVMAVLYRVDADPTRVYVGTDTHATALLIGAALAFGWPLAAPAPSLTAPGRRVLAVLGALALLGLAGAVYLMHGQGAVVFSGGFSLVAIGAAVLIAAAVHPRLRLGRLLGVAPLRWLGSRSYGIYLWHYPVIALARSAAGTRASTLVAQLAEAALAVGLAALSWRFVERPVQAIGVGSAVRAGAGRVRTACTGHARRDVAAVAGVSGLLVTAVLGLTLAPGVQRSVAGVKAQVDAGQRIADQSQHRAVLPTRVVTVPPVATTAPVPSAPGAPGSASQAPASQALASQALASQAPGSRAAASPAAGVPSTVGASTPSVPRPPPEPGSDVVGIGDSVMLAAAGALHDRLPGMAIDADVGRQLSDVPDVIRQHRADGTLRFVVVLAVGTNGAFTSSRLHDVLTKIGPGHRVVLVNTYAARDWEQGVNTTLAAAARRPEVTLVDWHAAIGVHTSELWGDGIHPQPVGAQRYAALLTAALPAVDRPRASSQNPSKAGSAFSAPASSGPARGSRSARGTPSAQRHR